MVIPCLSVSQVNLIDINFGRMLGSLCRLARIGQNHKRGHLMLRQVWRISERKELTQIRDKLIEDGHKLNSPTLIQLAHTLKFREDERGLLSEQEQQRVLSRISPDILRLSHRDLTLLLEVLRKVPRHRNYNRQNPLHRQLAQKMSGVQVLKIEKEYVYRLLHIMLEMGFPQMLITKYLQVVVSKTDQLTSKKAQIQVTSSLRIAITALELNYIPFYLFKDFYENVIEKQTIQQPLDLCLLHYMLSELPSALKNKLHYFTHKGKVHDLLFNPFSNLQSKDDGAEEEKDGVEEKQKNGAELKAREDTQKQHSQLAGQIELFLEGLQKKSNIHRLEQQLERIYGYEKFSMTPNSATFLCRVKSLEQVVSDYFQTNYKTLSPTEFMILAKTAPAQVREQVYGMYCQEMWSYLGVGQKLGLLQFGHQLCGRKPIWKEEIQKIVGEEDSLEHGQFLALGKFMQRHLDEEEQGHIIQMVKDLAQIK